MPSSNSVRAVNDISVYEVRYYNDDDDDILLRLMQSKKKIKKMKHGKYLIHALIIMFAMLYGPLAFIFKMQNVHF